MPQQGEPVCGCRIAPWIHTGMLVPKSAPGLYYCPEKLYCLHGTRLEHGRVADHWRNVPGECPWVGIEVVDRPRCECGRGPWINLRYLRIFLRKNLIGPVTAIGCPGLCPGTLVPVDDERIVDHPRDHRTPCPWSGTRIIPIGTPPPLFPSPR